MTTLEEAFADLRGRKAKLAELRTVMDDLFESMCRLNEEMRKAGIKACREPEGENGLFFRFNVREPDFRNPEPSYMRGVCKADECEVTAFGERCHVLWTKHHEAACAFHDARKAYEMAFAKAMEEAT